MTDVCETLHKEIIKLPRYHFPLDKEKIYKNGIYIIFEKNEFAHGGERIVRIGTHRGDNNLYNRLKEHFVNENKDRSIFRKNIGRSILNKNKDDYLEVWEIDFQERKKREYYKDRFDVEKQKDIEKQVSKYIHDNLSFAIIEILDKESRLYYESKLISTVSLCNKCWCSDTWLGKCSPKQKIRESGLWLVNELYKEPFSESELKQFKKNYLDKEMKECLK